MARLTDEELERLERLQDDMVGAFRSGDPRRFTQLNADWHFTLYTAARAKWLSEFIVRLWVRVPWDRTWVHPGRCERSIEEHVSIMMALRQRQAVEAGTLMGEHVASGSESLLELLVQETSTD